MERYDLLRVASLQEQGEFTTDTRLSLNATVNPAGDALTVCAWIYLSFIRGRTSYFISYASRDNDNEITGSMSELLSDSFLDVFVSRHEGLCIPVATRSKLVAMRMIQKKHVQLSILQGKCETLISAHVFTGPLFLV